MFNFLYKVDYKSVKFIHVLMYTYNKVMQLLELLGVVEWQWRCKCYVELHV